MHLTAYSLHILHLPPEATQAELESSALQAPIAQSLSAYAEACGPYGLQGWAEPRGHPLHFVDNCWVRAEVRGSDLPDFFADVVKAEVPLDPEIKPEGAYLIEAEEY